MENKQTEQPVSAKEEMYDAFIEQYNTVSGVIAHTKPLPMKYFNEFIEHTAILSHLNTVAIFKIKLKGGHNV
jgi:hypothetical protein